MLQLNYSITYRKGCEPHHSVPDVTFCSNGNRDSADEIAPRWISFEGHLSTLSSQRRLPVLIEDERLIHLKVKPFLEIFFYDDFDINTDQIEGVFCD